MWQWWLSAWKAIICSCKWLCNRQAGNERFQLDEMISGCGSKLVSSTLSAHASRVTLEYSQLFYTKSSIEFRSGDRAGSWRWWSCCFVWTTAKFVILKEVPMSKQLVFQMNLKKDYQATSAEYWYNLYLPSYWRNWWAFSPKIWFLTDALHCHIQVLKFLHT